jgi:hypothetical protein
MSMPMFMFMHHEYKHTVNRKISMNMDMYKH